MGELRKAGLGVAAITYDPVAVLDDFSKRRGITFPLLSDPGSATIKRYGILNTTVPETNQQTYGIPFPGTFMLNAQGVDTSRFFEQVYQERSTVGSIMARLGNNVDAQATNVSSPQLEITSFATDATSRQGRNFLSCSTFGRLKACTCAPQVSRDTSRLSCRLRLSRAWSFAARSIRQLRTTISGR